MFRRDYWEWTNTGVLQVETVTLQLRSPAQEWLYLKPYLSAEISYTVPSKSYPHAITIFRQFLTRALSEVTASEFSEDRV